MSPAARIRFSTFELDVESSELWNGAAKVNLAPKPVRLLALLAGSPGKLVGREAIREKLWEAGTFVDFEHGLNFCIREIRAALGDDARHPRFIETLPRRGYRFVCALKLAESASIEAYEQYLKGRANLGKLDKASLDQARTDFERSVTLDPSYAMAHSGLGATYAMRTITRRDSDDLEKARLHLTRALDLDPELAEPYPWLCYVHIRLSRLDLALAMGQRGVELLPKLVQARYFLGLAFYASSEQDTANYQYAAGHLLEATRLAPDWQASWFVLASTALAQGDYVFARQFAERLLEFNARGKGVPFLGAELVLASVDLRQGRPADAVESLAGFFTKLAASDHMYRDSMSAVAEAIMGDIELRAGNPVEALAAYRRGWHSVQEHTQFVAHQRICARVQSGLAAAYAACDERERGLELFKKAVELAARSHDSEHNAAAASLADLYWSLAVAALRLGDRARALASLEQAIEAGWLDVFWLENDPELEMLREEARFGALAERIRKTPKVEFVPHANGASL